MMGRNPYQSRWETFSEKDNHIVLDALEKTNLLHLQDRFTNQLSGGEQQRVRIARSMAQDTPILLLDEPLSNLDIVNQFEIMDILSYLNKNKKRTIIIVLHNFSIALQYVKQMMMIKEGKIIYSGNAQDVLTPAHIRELFDLSDQYLIDQQGNILKKTSDLF
jgi:iron complex transport system ATP-binding protein